MNYCKGFLQNTKFSYDFRKPYQEASSTDTKQPDLCMKPQMEVQPYVPQQLVPSRSRPENNRSATSHRYLVPGSQIVSPTNIPVNRCHFVSPRTPTRPPPARLYHHGHIQPRLPVQLAHFNQNIATNAQLIQQRFNPQASNAVNYISRNLRRLSRTGQSQKSFNDSVKQLKLKEERKNVGEKVRKKRAYIRWGFVVLIICIITFFTLPPIIPDLVMKVPSLKEDGLFTYLWANPPYGVNICIYLFGIKNGPQFLKGAKPHLEDVGPFCYYIYVTRKISEWKDKTVISNIKLTLEYNPKGSLGLDTPLTMINLPIFAGVLFIKNFLTNYYLSFLGSVLYSPIVSALRASGEELIEDIQARDILTDRKIKIMDKIDLSVLAPLRSIGIPIPQEFTVYGFKISHWQVGLATTLSGVEIGPMEENKATENGHLMGSFVGHYGNKFFLSDHPTCDQDTGGVTIYFMSPVTERRLTAVIPLFCRQLWFTRERTVSFYGVELTRYQFDSQMFNSSRKENQCFCRKQSRRLCEGWHDMSPCMFQAPLGFSLPHFYGNRVAQSRVVGLKPDPDRHQFFLDYETTIGVPANAHVALQAVLDVAPVTQVDSLSSLPVMQLPLFWAEAHEGAFGILGYLFCITSYSVRYGAYVWLGSGLVFSGYLFARGLLEKKINPL